MHDVVSDQAHFLEKPRQCPTVDFQVELRPDLRMLEESYVLTECEIRNDLRFVPRPRYERTQQIKIGSAQLIPEEASNVKLYLAKEEERLR